MLFLAADHAGFRLKEEIKRKLTEQNISFEDLGTDSEDSVDYPEYADKLTERVSQTSGQGILFCGSGEGMAMAANRRRGIRAAVVWDPAVAKETREDNDANVLSLPARFLDDGKAWQIVDTFLKTPFSTEERHMRRVKAIDAI